MATIAVTDQEFDKAKEVFRASVSAGHECVRVPGREESLADGVREHGARHVIVGVASYGNRLYDALSRGGVIARFGVGHDGIDKALASKRGLLCTNTPGALDDSVAEHTMGLLLSAARGLTALAQATRTGDWRSEIGTELRDKTLAVIGCGAIGNRVARMASFGLSMRVVGCEVAAVDTARLKRQWGYVAVVSEFAEAADADFVTLHIPASLSTRRYIDRGRLSVLPERAWLINTARGSVVDESALFDALAGGHLAGAALDVFEREPYEPVTPAKDLRTLENVIMTPHVASSTREACRRMAERALHNIRLAEAGRYDEMDLLNPDVCHQDE